MLKRHTTSTQKSPSRLHYYYDGGSLVMSCVGWKFQLTIALLYTAFYLPFCPSMACDSKKNDKVQTLFNLYCWLVQHFARFQLTLRVARSLGDSWVSCFLLCSLAPTFLGCSGCSCTQWNGLRVCAHPEELTPAVISHIRFCVFKYLKINAQSH